MAQSLQFFRRIMLLLNVTVGAFLVWVFGMTPVLAARQADGVAFAQNLSALPAKPWTLAIAVLGMAALILAGVLRRRGQNFIGWIEPLFALCVIFALHLAYNGLLLYVVVDLIDGLHGRTRRRFLGAMTALFLLTGLGALQGALHVVPFSEYLLYFDMHTRQLLQSVVDLLGALQSGAENGVQYALPYECVPTLMCVNKTLLESEGITVPSGDWTWEDFYNICAKVTRDTDGDGENDQFGCYGYTWQDALTANGASLFTEDGGSCLISEPKAVQAVAFAQRLGKLTAETAPSARDFDEGKVAFRPFLFSDYRTYQPYPWRIKRYSDFSWDCIPMPHGPAGGNSSELSTVLAGISSRSANMTLAWQFLRELTANADNQSMLFTDSHSVSALRSVTDSDETRRTLRQDTPGESRNGVETLSDVMEQAVAAPRFRNYDQALLLTEGLVQNAMEDEHNLSLQLQRVQHEVQEYLQK